MRSRPHPSPAAWSTDASASANAEGLRPMASRRGGPKPAPVRSRAGRGAGGAIPRRIGATVQEARLQRYSVDSELRTAIQEIVGGPPLVGGGLARPQLAEEPVVRVAVDTYAQVVFPCARIGPSRRPAQRCPFGRCARLRPQPQLCGPPDRQAIYWAPSDPGPDLPACRVARRRCRARRDGGVYFEVETVIAVQPKKISLQVGDELPFGAVESTWS